jgi:hypothetical protein
MSQPEIKLGLVANLFSRMMHFVSAGDMEVGHTHQFDHLTLLASGSLKVTVDGVSDTFVAPMMIYIHKDKVHELTALEDNTVAYCIHALRADNAGNTILDPESIPTASRAMSPLEFLRSGVADRVTCAGSAGFAAEVARAPGIIDTKEL